MAQLSGFTAKRVCLIGTEGGLLWDLNQVKRAHWSVLAVLNCYMAI